MDDILYTTLSRYFNKLSKFGYTNYNEVYDILYLLLIRDFVYNDFYGYITEDDYRYIERSLYCLFGKSCLIPYPQYLIMERNLYLGSLSELAYRINRNELDISQLRDNVDTLDDKIDTNIENVENNSQQIQVNSERITANSNRIDNNSKRIDSNLDRINSNSDRIESNSNSINANSNMINTNSNRINTINNSIEEIKQTKVIKGDEESIQINDITIS